ncbi:hypothetical protein KUCAC02_011267 [Chaenocephalus aceratus]|uniref:Uncharacterized protein n=1 Tax=Chaenocephalus aceratus TaxID=36190 RepID=A0ACB9WVB8_CHAAC|nr:hypothetical protein KUCAC02_011267 [Chaenocephalus aceratus]
MATGERRGGGEGEKELLATPVQLVKTLMICNFAPPSTELHGQGEGSRENWTEELEKEDHSNGDKQLLSEVMQYRSHKGIVSSVHADSRITTEGDMLTPRYFDSQADLQSDATEVEHNRVLKSSEWVDTITPGTYRTRTVEEQVAVELSAPNADTQRPAAETQTHTSETYKHPAEVEPDLNQG